MLTSQELDEVALRVIRHASAPAKVIVFGSYGRGDADEHSDLDLLVVERDVSDKAAEYLRLKEAIGRVGVGVDLLIFSEPDFERRSLVPGTVPYWAKIEGKVLHDPAA